MTAKIQPRPATLLEPAVIRELTRSVPGFDRAGLLSSLVACWGGQENLARAIYVEFNRAAGGSMVRQRILEMIARMVSQQSTEERRTPPEEMTDEDLHRAILLAVPELQRVTDGDHPPGPERHPEA